MNQAVMDILARTSGTSAGSPYDAMVKAAVAEAAKKAPKAGNKGFLPASAVIAPSRTVMTPHLAEFGNRRLPISSLKPQFVPSPSPIDGQGQPTLPDVLIEPTIDEEVELFAPLETTDWKKYWPLAAAAVGAIGVVMLMRRRKG